MKDKEKQIFDKYGNYDFPTEIKQEKLNTATTQIEGMAKVIESVKLYGKDNYERKISRDSVLDLAKKLLKYYQPKLPEDSVVLSMEEMQEIIVKAKVKEREKISELKKEIKEINKLLIQEKEGSFWDGVNEGILKGSKETAEKFYKKVRKLLKKVDIIVDGDEGLVGYEESAVDKGLTEIAKQFGVEIKE